MTNEKVLSGAATHLVHLLDDRPCYFTDYTNNFNCNQTHRNIKLQFRFPVSNSNQNQEISYDNLCLLVLMEIAFRRDVNDR